VLGFPDLAPSPPVPRAATSAAALAAAAAGQHLDLQLLGPWTDLFGYTLPEDVAVAWSRAYNEALVAECASSPHQLPMATVPLAHPARAAEELEAARDLGCRGVMIGTDLPGRHLGSADLDPFWSAASNLAMPVLLHPTHLVVPEELAGSGLKNAVGRAHPTGLALTRLVYGGALERHPGLRFIACHGGGAFAAVAPRVLRNHELGWSETEVDVAASVGRLHFDSVVLDPALLRYLVASYGADRFVLGSDQPFPWEPDPVGTLLRADLGPEDTAAIAGDNARRWYGLPPSADCAECAAG
jgi:aminocarboxymuconate-semialdehyde decarboxylase